MLIIWLLILTGCSHNNVPPIFVQSKVYILDKQENKDYKITDVSQSEDLQKEINLAPPKIIGLTQGKFKQLKDKILELKAANSVLRRKLE